MAEDETDGIIDSVDINLGKLWEIVEDRGFVFNSRILFLQASHLPP